MELRCIGQKNGHDEVLLVGQVPVEESLEPCERTGERRAAVPFVRFAEAAEERVRRIGHPADMAVERMVVGLEKFEPGK